MAPASYYLYQFRLAHGRGNINFSLFFIAKIEPYSFGIVGSYRSRRYAHVPPERNTHGERLPYVKSGTHSRAEFES